MGGKHTTIILKQNTIMKAIQIAFILIFSALLTSPAFGEENKQFDTDKILADLEKQLQLSKKQIESLKPEIEAKSSSILESINGVIDKGFLEADKLTEQLSSVTQELEKSARELLTNEEVQDLREYLNSIDKEAIHQVKNSLVANLSEILQLTEEQASKVKPIIEESFEEISSLITQLITSGSNNLDEFRVKFDEISSNLLSKVKDILNKEQMEMLEKHNQDLKETIEQKTMTI